MRRFSNTSSTWAPQAVPLRWPLGLWIAEVPFPVWALLIVAMARRDREAALDAVIECLRTVNPTG